MVEIMLLSSSFPSYRHRLLPFLLRVELISLCLNYRLVSYFPVLGLSLLKHFLPLLSWNSTLILWESSGYLTGKRKDEGSLIIRKKRCHIKKNLLINTETWEIHVCSGPCKHIRITGSIHRVWELLLNSYNHKK